MKYFCFLVVFVLTGCATMTPVREYDRVVDNRGLVSKESKPAWIDNGIQFNEDSTSAVVVGVSKKYSCEKSARDDAERNALDKTLKILRGEKSEIKLRCYQYPKKSYIERHEVLSEGSIEYYYRAWVLMEIGGIERR